MLLAAAGALLLLLLLPLLWKSFLSAAGACRLCRHARAHPAAAAI
jgi:hypothetical protein